MNRSRWIVLLGLALAALSAALYLAHYALFRDGRHIFLYLVGDLAFLPVQVLFVTLILDRLLSRREKQAVRKNLNMLIGVFYSFAGTALLGSLSAFSRKAGGFGETLIVSGEWARRDFDAAARRFRNLDPGIDCDLGDLPSLRGFLLEKRPFLMTLMGNPNLVEHESFTDLLWAVFHLADELAAREDLSRLAPPDAAHLSGDIQRALSALVCEWLGYLKNLKEEYPYLFSLAVRTNPFDPSARVEVVR